MSYLKTLLKRICWILGAILVYKRVDGTAREVCKGIPKSMCRDYTMYYSFEVEGSLSFFQGFQRTLAWKDFLRKL